jgi:hypothetical protein
VATLPPAVRRRLIAALEGEGRLRFAIDDEALEHGAIALYGTIGLIWGLRPDGSVWEFDSDFGIPLTPIKQEWENTALALGAERYPWLAEVLPGRPPHASECPQCQGRGWVGVGSEPGSRGFVCPSCRVLGGVEQGPGAGI